MQLDSIRRALAAETNLIITAHESQAFAQLLQSQIMRVFIEGNQREVTIVALNCYRTIEGIQLHTWWK